MSEKRDVTALPLNEPNAVLIGERIVRCNTDLSRTGCQVVETHTDALYRVEWRPCGLPVFASVYAGQYDDEKHEDVQPVVCWKHLRAIGDTRDLIVRPA